MMADCREAVNDVLPIVSGYNLWRRDGHGRKLLLVANPDDLLAKPHGGGNHGEKCLARLVHNDVVEGGHGWG